MNKIKFKKTIFLYQKCFISLCGEYKIIKYGDKIYAYHKIDSRNEKGKRVRLFGNSIEHDHKKESMTYKNYREAMRRVNMFYINQPTPTEGVR